MYKEKSLIRVIEQLRSPNYLTFKISSQHTTTKHLETLKDSILKKGKKLNVILTGKDSIYSSGKGTIEKPRNFMR